MHTRSGNLAARYVIHTVGPIYRNAQESAPFLKSAYQESLKVAESLRLHSVSFPSISTGAYGYPVEEAARVALQAITEYLRGDTNLELIQIVCFTADAYSAFNAALDDLND